MSSDRVNQSIEFDINPLIGITDMCAALQKSRATVHRWVKTQKLIAPVYRNRRTLGWCPNEFKRWQLSQDNAPKH
ncbi:MULTISPECIES: helix-turn-helix transcriptional regulator [Shewanella]|uniref:helix-turn-helix transcriptional regulator n=1 Tax=Shewanella TaxID=22 RepID=UPI001F4C2943|nr:MULTISPECIES: hypothetical protein [Shewanella]MCH7422111.1 hypothetical protein [Shewanella sp. MM_2022_3]MCT8868012.1 hypothetical protein [Shewanella xiamenensis]